MVWNRLLLATTALCLTTLTSGIVRLPAAEESRYERYRQVFRPIPALPPIPADNSITEARVRLGQMLYWDRRTSKTGQTSCGFCHHPAYYGAEPMQRSLGVFGELHAANAHTVLNAAYHPAQFFSGSATTLEDQALAAIRSHVAARSWPPEVAARLNRLSEYRELAQDAYGKALDEEVIGKAIATFMRTLVTPDYPLARWLRGDEQAMTERQKRGMALFADRGCIACHASPYFSNFTYQKIVIEGGEHHLGRYTVTKDENDKFRYKVPSLLNVVKTPPYTHAGVVTNLPDMVRLMGAKMLNRDLPAGEVDDIVAFLHALTGKMPPHFSSIPVLPIGGGDGDFRPGLAPSTKN